MPAVRGKESVTVEWMILGAFCAGLVVCVVSGMPILFALVFGLILFMLYGKSQGLTWRQVLLSAAEGVGVVRNILITFLLIGSLTALWRAAGTIPLLVVYASRMIQPSVFLTAAFLLNCGISVLTGTSFGTAATMGVICAAMGSAMKVSPVLTGGAVLSGVYFGDRCSPISTSALLVSTVTETEIYSNVRSMFRTAAVPFVITCVLYLCLGAAFPGEGKTPDMAQLFLKTFHLHGAMLIPAAVILILAAAHVPVKTAMSVSILTAVPVCLYIQRLDLTEIVSTAVFGFHPGDAETEALMGGGGIVSMVRVAAIVCLSSSYAGIFRKTGLLDKLKGRIAGISGRTTPFTAMLITSAAAAMIACNQTLTILLTHQLCAECYQDRSQLAEDLEDSAVIVAPLIPWSIAGAVPLAAAGAPAGAVATAFYLAAVPVYRLVTSLLEKKSSKKQLKPVPATGKSK